MGGRAGRETLRKAEGTTGKSPSYSPGFPKYISELFD